MRAIEVVAFQFVWFVVVAAAAAAAAAAAVCSPTQPLDLAFGLGQSAMGAMLLSMMLVSSHLS